MANGFLKVTALGNLGRDPEKRYTSDGKPVTRFSMAATKRVRGRDGEWEDETDWLSVIVFGRTAETMAERLSKGSRVYVEGRLHKRDYETQSGSKGSSLDVIASDIQILDSPRRSEDNGYQPELDEDLGPPQPRPRAAAGRAGLDSRSDPDLEDLPF